MAYITEFTISGLAGRDGVYHQILDRHTNIFFGFNGSGKTSLLKILHSAMSRDGRILDGVPFHTAEVKIFSVDYDQEFTLTASSSDKSKNKKAVRERELSSLQESLFEFSVET